RSKLDHPGCFRPPNPTKKAGTSPTLFHRHGAGLMHRTGAENKCFRPPESWAPADLIAVAHIRIIPFEFPPGRSNRSCPRPTLTSDENHRISEPSTSTRLDGDLSRV